MFFVLRRFSFTYQQMLYQLNRSWGVLCIIPMTTFLTILYAINHLENSVSRVPCEQENRRDWNRPGLFDQPRISRILVSMASAMRMWFSRS